MRAQNPALIARLSELEGKVDIKQAGQAAFAPAKPDAQLEAQGQLQTGADGRSRLDLSTGTIVRVAPDSLFTLISNEEAAGGLFTKIKLELGKVFIILNGGNAEVQTPAGMAAVQGSYLKVEFDPAVGELTLTCLEGDCSVTTPGGGTKHFTDGQKITVHKDPATGEWIMDEGPMILEDFQEWLENNPEAKEKVERVKAILDADLRNAALTAMPNPQLPSLNLPDADKEKLKDLIDYPPFP
jgi:ferric-dicitrate binding protein FerR (iron transport regulator)